MTLGKRAEIDRREAELLDEGGDGLPRGLVLAREEDDAPSTLGGPMRFSELKRAIGGVTQRMLTLTLRGLERDGVVTRTVTPTRPPRVDYELTSLGRSLRGPIEALGQWSFENLDVIHRSREAYDAAVTAED